MWNVSPEIFTIGQFQLRWYGVLFALSFFLGYRILLNVFRKETIDIKYLDKLVLYMGIGTLIGARLGHCLLYQPDYYLSNPLEILKIWKGGLASHGAAVGIIIALGIYALAEKINFLWIIDRMVIVVALSGFLIRIGNFINSEIIGKPTTLMLGVIFTAHDMIPRHPVQLYEALCYLVVFLSLLLIYFKTKLYQQKGFLFGVFLVVVFTCRFFIEFYKENQVDAEADFIINFGQLYSIPFILLGFVLLISRLLSLFRNR